MTKNKGLSTQSYPSIDPPVNAWPERPGARGVACGIAGILILVIGRGPVFLQSAAAVTQATIVPRAALDAALEADACPPHLANRFAPADPDGRDTYRVCRSPRALDELRESTWPVEPQTAAAAFAGAPPEVLRRLALLYGGAIVTVARGWRVRDGDVEAVTLIAPPPDDDVSVVTAGTLIVVQRRPARTDAPVRRL